MQRIFRAFTICFTFLSLTLILGGCGPSTRTVDLNGKLILPKGLKLSDNDLISVVFFPMQGGNTPGGTATMSAKDSTFSMKVPAGEHKISVKIQAYPGEKGSDVRQQKLDKTMKPYEWDSTTVKCEVPDQPPQQSITIDLITGMVKQN